MSAEALERLIAQIDISFDRPEGGRGETVAHGLYRDSWFYPAHGRFICSIPATLGPHVC